MRLNEVTINGFYTITVPAYLRGKEHTEDVEVLVRVRGKTSQGLVEVIIPPFHTIYLIEPCILRTCS